MLVFLRGGGAAALFGTVATGLGTLNAVVVLRPLFALFGTSLALVGAFGAVGVRSALHGLDALFAHLRAVLADLGALLAAFRASHGVRAVLALFSAVLASVDTSVELSCCCHRFPDSLVTRGSPSAAFGP